MLTIHTRAHIYTHTRTLTQTCINNITNLLPFRLRRAEEGLLGLKRADETLRDRRVCCYHVFLVHLLLYRNTVVRNPFQIRARSIRARMHTHAYDRKTFAIVFWRPSFNPRTIVFQVSRNIREQNRI